MCVHECVHICSTMKQLLCNMFVHFLCSSNSFPHVTVSPSINFSHDFFIFWYCLAPSLRVRCFQPRSHLTGSIMSQDTDGGEGNERRGLLWWDSVHLLSLNSLVISLKCIILTAGQRRGPNLACEMLSSTPQLLRDDVPNQ